MCFKCCNLSDLLGGLQFTTYFFAFTHVAVDLIDSQYLRAPRKLAAIPNCVIFVAILAFGSNLSTSYRLV